MEKICCFCNKRFANGKAMGGHLRSHYAKHPLPPKPNPLPHQPQHPKSPPSPSSSSMHSYRSQNNHELIAVITDHPRPAASVMIKGGDTGSESPRSGLITCRRSKRRRTVESESVTGVAVELAEQASSDSEICLVDEEREKTPTTATKRGSYRCNTCKKLFRSYQALGGHRASHKKMKGIVIKDEEAESEDEEGSGSGGGADEVVGGFKCPFCDKVFESGQALGGHKKVHFSYLPVAAPAPAPAAVGNSAKSGGVCLDLNRPADELSDGEVSIGTAIEAAEAYCCKYIVLLHL
ncbi:zinc finger protein ZAT1-like [Tripterygium wilfordii]|uniref:zinc finger protein ZAT1-like n=1 Tax=Tripterygium wilfordii TaxID=458696 RepID=UPI0018F8058C|nr:zinc finger protein ZAT1-like [Tripterygium wilfordii]